MGLGAGGCSQRSSWQRGRCGGEESKWQWQGGRALTCPARCTCSTVPSGLKGDGARGTRTCVFLIWGDLGGLWSLAVMDPHAHGKQLFTIASLLPPGSKTLCSARREQVQPAAWREPAAVPLAGDAVRPRAACRAVWFWSLKAPSFSSHSSVTPHLCPFLSEWVKPPRDLGVEEAGSMCLCPAGQGHTWGVGPPANSAVRGWSGLWKGLLGIHKQ